MQTLRHFVLFFIKKEANYYLVIFRDPNNLIEQRSVLAADAQDARKPH